MATLVIMALREESQGLFEAAGYEIFYSGMGLVKSSHAITKLIEKHKPTTVLNLGTAGSHSIKAGSIVECSAFVQRAPHSFLPIPSTKITTSPQTTLPHVMCGSGDFVEITHPQTNCDIFDMEAYALAYCCKEMNVRFNSIKFVTDQSNENTLQDWRQQLKHSAIALLQELKKWPLERT